MDTTIGRITRMGDRGVRSGTQGRLEVLAAPYSVRVRSLVPIACHRAQGVIVTGRGRPTHLDADKERKFLDAVRAGVPITDAAAVAGVSARTVFRWMERGRAEQERLDGLEAENPGEPGSVASRESERDFCHFWHRYTRARSEATAKLVLLIQRGAQGGAVVEERTRTYRDRATGEQVTQTDRRLAPPDWRAASWLLARMDPTRFGAQVEHARVEVTGPDGGPVQVEDAAALARLSDRLHRIQVERATQAGPVGEVLEAELVEGLRAGED